MKFTAPWLPDGPIELAPIPLKGERELRHAELRDSEVEVYASEFRFYTICTGLLAAETVLQKLGVAKAKESWDEHIVMNFSVRDAAGNRTLVEGFDAFIWPEAEFEARLKENKDAFIHQKLAAKDDADAWVKLKEKGAEITAKGNSLDKKAIERIGQRPLIALYWRLSASGVTKILTPGGPYAIDWGTPGQSKESREAKRDEVLDVLSEVVSEVDLEAAMGIQRRPKVLDLAEVMPKTSAEVEGKSDAASPPSTPSSPSSPSSSEPISATI